jgi:ribosomal protein S18 acetylase RimI-like enzyme
MPSFPPRTSTCASCYDAGDVDCPYPRAAGAPAGWRAHEGEDAPMIAIRPLSRLESALARALISGYTSAERYTFTREFSWDHLIFAGQRVPCDPPYNKLYPPPRPEDLARYDALAAAGHAFSAFAGPRCVALAICEPMAWNQSLLLWELHVAPDWRRQGIGRQMIEAVVGHARQLGLRRVRLETQATNVPAIRFYSVQGFAVVGVDIALYAGTETEAGEAAVFMALDVSEPA